MKASPKINPHELIESARDLSNTTAIVCEKMKLENPLNSTYKAEETDRSISELRSTKISVKKAVLSEDEKTCRRCSSALRDSDSSRQ